jgi:hypothetical protein
MRPTSLCCKLTDDGFANPEKASREVADAFSKFPNWQRSESELRELRKKVTAGGDGGSSALAQASSPRGCICHLGPTPSLVAKPIDWPIDHSARRRVIAPYRVPSRFATNSATMVGSAITLQSPRVCTSGLSNAPWEELTERRTSSTGTPFSCSIASTGSLPDSKQSSGGSLRKTVAQLRQKVRLQDCCRCTIAAA